MKNYFALLRCKHYIKNVLIFVPLVFSGKLNNAGYIWEYTWGFISFSLLSSCVYIINDLNDYEYDTENLLRRKRPIASGAVSKRQAFLILYFFLALVVIIGIISLNFFCIIYELLYLLINILYSVAKMKNIPIVDIIMVASGYLLRVLYGGAVASITISPWLMLTTISFAIYLAIGKRWGELRKETIQRPVLSKYSESFLEKNMYLFLSTGIVFYSMWAIENNKVFVYTVPLVLFILMYYNWLIEKKDGDPIEVVFSEPILIILIILFIFVTVFLLYM